MRALDEVSVEFDAGHFTAVMGPSGSGKSTLMHCMAGLDVPRSGQTFVGQQEIGRLNDAGLTRLRRERIGFIFQSFNLIPTLTAAENITLSADPAGRSVEKEWFDYLVGQLGIAARLSHRPSDRVVFLGAVVGTVVGTVLGLAMASALRNDGVTTLSVPIGTTVVFLLFCGVLGLVAASWPARRAAKLDVLRAIATE